MHDTASGWQYFASDGAQVQLASGGIASLLSPLLASEPPALSLALPSDPPELLLELPPGVGSLGVDGVALPVPALPEHWQTSSASQVNPAPQSVAVVQGCVHLGAQTLSFSFVHGTGSRGGGHEAPSGSHAGSDMFVAHGTS